MNVQGRTGVTFASVTVVLVSALLGVSIQPAWGAENTTTADAGNTPVRQQDLLGEVPSAARADVLGEDWQSSTDVAVVASGDMNGFRVQRARESDGYSWETIATLSVDGVETDRWIGNYCVTADARSVAVVYGARAMTNSESLFNRGGYGTIVNVETGEVTQLGQGFTLAYFSPACGPSQDVLFTSYGDEGAGTRLTRLDAGQPATPETTTQVDSQVTSPVVTSDGLIAAAGGGLVSIQADGSLKALAQTDGTPYSLTTDSSGGIAFLDTDGRSAQLKYLHKARDPGQVPDLLATGPIDRLGVVADASGGVHISGEPDLQAALPPTMTVLDAPADATVSSQGNLALYDVTVPTASAPSAPDPFAATVISAVVTQSSRKLSFAAAPTGASTVVENRLEIMSAASPWGSGSENDPVETERACSVPRNDPTNQALQPKPRQVEWAVDQAVNGALTVGRPANWKNLGMPAYTPQGLFPRPALAGGGQVPAQVMLGVLAQESNLWQASRYTTPGVTGNPLIGNYYGVDRNGTDADNWAVDFSDADCGYGVAQVTDGMRLAGRENGGVAAYPYNQQRAIALDFAANIAKGLQILGSKWNQTKQAGLTVNNGDPDLIENWFFAVWAYNSGFYPNQGNNQPWGVGWLNNPANPNYPPGRTPFLDGSPQDASNPQRWPYPEKVLGFAAHSLELYEDAATAVPGFRTAYWLSNDGNDGTLNRYTVKPPIFTFCIADNHCDPAARQQPADTTEPPGPCLNKSSTGSYDLKCWYNGNATWKDDCDSTCGREYIRFDPGWAYQPDAGSFPPNCSTAGLPAGALVVDNLPNTQPVIREGCPPLPSAGRFDFRFGAAPNGTYPSKIDVHQLGAGLNGQFHFAHTRSPSPRGGLYGGSMEVTGAWTLGQSLPNTWTRVLVHMPDHGAWTQQASYTINMGDGTTKKRVVPQQHFANTWVSLGVFKINGTPSVSLSNVTADGIGYDDIAWDAVAFQPLPQKPDDIVVALGDSFSSGEGASTFDGADYYPDSDKDGTDPQMRNACHRSTKAWPLKATLPTRSGSNATRTAAWDTTLDFQFLACSGAETEHILPSTAANAEGQTGTGLFHELSQIDRGFLDENTTLVTLSIGGNDARFGPILMSCITLGVMAPTAYCKDDTLPGDTKILEEATAQRTSTTIKQSVATVLENIRSRAPNATILLMGYPKLFETGSACVGITGQNMPWLNTVSDDLNEGLAAAAAAVSTLTAPVIFANPQNVFAGKNLCTPDSAITGLVFDHSRGDKPMFPLPIPGPNLGMGVSQQSVHPNKTGTTLYARVMQDALQGTYP